MFYLLVILIFFIIYIIASTLYRNSIINKYDFYRERPEISPAIAGYIYNKRANNFSLILSEILDLTQKGYIKLDYVEKQNGEKDYLFTKGASDFNNLKSYEMIAYRTLFDNNKEEVFLHDLEIKANKDVEFSQDSRVKAYSIEMDMNHELFNQGVVKEYQKARRITYNDFLVYMVVMIIIIFIMHMLNINFANGVAWFAVINYIYIFSIKFLKEINKYTEYGKEEISKIYGYARFLRQYGDFKEKELAHVVLWEDAYIYAIAFGIPIKGIKEFIGDEVRINEAKTSVKKAFKKVLGRIAILIIFAMIILIIFCIVKLVGVLR